MHGDQICLDERFFILNVVTSDLSSAVLNIDTYHFIAFIHFAIAIQADGVIILVLLLVDHTDLHVFSSYYVVRTDVNISTVRQSSTLNQC